MRAPALVQRLAGFFSRGRLRDLNEEMEQHLELLAEEYLQKGLSASDARAAARRHFGNLGQVREKARETAMLPSLDSLSQDVRFAVRRLKKEPLLALVAIVSIGLGIGASTAMFSVVNSVLLRPLPFPEPERLVLIREMLPPLAHLYPSLPANGRHFLQWREQSKSFENLAALKAVTLNLTGVGQPERLSVGRVSPNFFPLLGIQPALGRNFLNEEDQPGRDHVVLLSHAFWMSRFGGDPRVLNSRVLLNGEAYLITGVLPSDFHPFKYSQLGDLVTLGDSMELFKPLALDQQEQTSYGDYDYAVLGRLKPGVTRAQAFTEMETIQQRLTKALPVKVDYHCTLVPLQEQITGSVRRSLWLLLAAVCGVLLIVCVNLASLMLARATRQRREAAVRTALGASSSRLLQQAMVESALIAILGGLLGILVCYAAAGALAAFSPASIPRMEEVRLDTHVLGFGLALVALTGILFGAAPAWLLSRADAQEALKAGSHTTTASRSGLRLRELFVGSEVAVCTVLLITCGLLAGSLFRLSNVDRGFEVDSVIAVDLTLPSTRYKTKEQTTAAYDRILEKMQSLPGVRSAALISYLPFGGDAHVNNISLPGTELPPAEQPVANFRYISPEYFQTMGIPLLAGRAFERMDREHRVGIVSDRVAQKLWPGENVIGKRFHPASTEVIGVAGATREVRLQQEPLLMVYLPYWLRPQWRMGIVVRTSLRPEAVAGLVRPAVWGVDPEIPIASIRTMRQILSDSIAPRRFQTLLVSVFGAAAIIIAALGIYGLVAYSVAQRTNEFGIRIALGAQGADLYQLVIRQGLRPVIGGLAAGLACALAVSRSLNSLLFETSTSDPIAFGAVTALLGIVALVACYVPARRTAKMDPNLALRYE